MMNFNTEFTAESLEIIVREKWDGIERDSGFLYFEAGKPIEFYRNWRNVEDCMSTDISVVAIQTKEESNANTKPRRRSD